LKGLLLFVTVAPNANGGPEVPEVGWKVNEPAAEGLAGSGSWFFCPKENPAVGGWVWPNPPNEAASLFSVLFSVFAKELDSAEKGNCVEVV